MNTIEFLHEKLRSIVDAKVSTLYVHSIKITPNGVKLQLVEQPKLIALVNNRWNPQDDHGKYTVLVIETDEDGVPAPH